MLSVGISLLRKKWHGNVDGFSQPELLIKCCACIMLHGAWRVECQEIFVYAIGNFNDALCTPSDNAKRDVLSGMVSLVFCRESLLHEGILFHK